MGFLLVELLESEGTMLLVIPLNSITKIIGHSLCQYHRMIPLSLDGIIFNENPVTI